MAKIEPNQTAYADVPNVVAERHISFFWGGEVRTCSMTPKF